MGHTTLILPRNKLREVTGTEPGKSVPFRGLTLLLSPLTTQDKKQSGRKNPVPFKSLHKEVYEIKHQWHSVSDQIILAETFKPEGLDIHHLLHASHSPSTLQSSLIAFS